MGKPLFLRAMTFLLIKGWGPRDFGQFLLRHVSGSSPDAFVRPLTACVRRN